MEPRLTRGLCGTADVRMIELFIVYFELVWPWENARGIYVEAMMGETRQPIPALYDVQTCTNLVA